ncbi:MAG TPA: SDR family oxidoreductase [Terriglobales bacterium]|nr:SDR family oxidoreductase [Terriglobales bacterium]
MKIVVIGGTGLIGSKLVNKLREHGHEAVAAAPNTGVNTLTGEGLSEALKGASVVVDVSNSPSWDDAAVLKFFETSTRNLLTYEAAAGVRHHVALSVVGTDRLSESGYFRAKITQEKLIRESSIPYTIVHATQFFEFLKGLADISMVGDKVHLPPVLFQPMAADDVASGVARVAVGQPVNGIVEIGGPEQFRVDELVRRRLATLKDPRQVIADPRALYSGAKVSERTLIPGSNARLGETRFETWLTQSLAQIPSPHPQRTGVAAAAEQKERREKAS